MARPVQVIGGVEVRIIGRGPVKRDENNRNIEPDFIVKMTGVELETIARNASFDWSTFGRDPDKEYSLSTLWMIGRCLDEVKTGREQYMRSLRNLLLYLEEQAVDKPATDEGNAGT